MKVFEVRSQITCCRSDHETHQFLSRKNFQQRQQPDTILDVLEQVCHDQWGHALSGGANIDLLRTRFSSNGK